MKLTWFSDCSLVCSLFFYVADNDFELKVLDKDFLGVSLAKIVMIFVWSRLFSFLIVLYYSLSI